VICYVDDCLNLGRVGLDPAVRHQVAQYLPLANTKDALLGVEAKSCVPHVCECLCEVSQMVFFISACDDDVVHVNYTNSNPSVGIIYLCLLIFLYIIFISFTFLISIFKNQTQVYILIYNCNPRIL
jgi:hypothetical protein